MSYLKTRIKDFLNWRNPVMDIQKHLDEAAGWILRAQKATPDDGVAHSYDFKEDKWLASYPETTGYIIETLYKYANRFEKPEYAEAARKMALWESQEQFDEGGVRAGKMDADTVVPTIFNTGQVLFGWAAAIENEKENAVFIDSITKASDWLVDAMDEDGAWRKFASPFGGVGKESSYNTRVAYGLVRAFEVTANRRYLEAAEKNVDYVLSISHENGFLPHNCLSTPESPLIHTIAYSIRGIYEVGLKAVRSDFIDLAERMAAAVAIAQSEDGSIPGTLNKNWQPDSKWSCLTGNSQMAINWLRMALASGNDKFVDNAINSNLFNMSTQVLDGDNANIKGAIKGSMPITGGYMTNRFPNWATKFFMDALMFEIEWREKKQEKPQGKNGDNS